MAHRIIIPPTVPGSIPPIPNPEHRASEKRLVTHYMVTQTCSNPIAPVGFELIPNGCGYRNICGDWILMTPNIQHPEHSPTTLEGKICIPGHVYKFVWDYEGEFGLDPTEFESDHSFIVGLAHDDQSCGWVDPCVDPDTCHKVPGTCISAGDCVVGEPGEQGNCCDGWLIRIDQSGGPLDGCPYCWLDEGPGTGPTGPATDPTGPWTIHTENPPITFPTEHTEPNGPDTWQTVPGHDAGDVVTIDDPGGPTWVDGGRHDPHGGVVLFDPGPEPPRFGPAVPSLKSFICISFGTCLEIQGAGGYANITDCLASLECQPAVAVPEGYCIGPDGTIQPDPNSILEAFGFGNMFVSDPCAPGGPKGTPPKPTAGAYTDPSSIPDDSGGGLDDLPSFGGWVGKNTSSASDTDTRGGGGNPNHNTDTNTVNLHGGVEGNYFDAKMDSIQGLLRRGARVSKYMQSFDPTRTNYAKSTNYDRLAGSDRKDRGKAGTSSINKSLSSIRRPGLSAEFAPKTAIKIVGREAFFRSHYGTKGLFSGGPSQTFLTPIARRSKRWHRRLKNTLTTRGDLRAGTAAVEMFFDESAQNASTLTRGTPIKVPKMKAKGPPIFISKQRTDSFSHNWEMALHARLKTGFAKNIFVTVVAASKYRRDNTSEYQLQLSASQGSNTIELASSSLRTMGVNHFKIAGSYPVGFAPGTVVITSMVRNADGDVEAMKQVEVEIYALGGDHKGGIRTSRTIATRNTRGALLSKLAEGEKFTFYKDRPRKSLVVLLKSGRDTNVTLSAVSDAAGDPDLLHSLKLIEPVSKRVIMQNQGFLNDEKNYNFKQDKRDARGVVWRGLEDNDGDLLYIPDKTMLLQISQIGNTKSHWTTVTLGQDLVFGPTELNVSFDSALNRATCTGSIPLAKHGIVLFATGRKYVVRTSNSVTTNTDNTGQFTAILDGVTPGQYIGLAIETSLPLASNTVLYTQVK